MISSTIYCSVVSTQATSFSFCKLRDHSVIFCQSFTFSPSFTRSVFHSPNTYSNTLGSISFMIITPLSIFVITQANFDTSFCLSVVLLASICFTLISCHTFTATSKCSSK